MQRNYPWFYEGPKNTVEQMLAKAQILHDPQQDTLHILAPGSVLEELDKLICSDHPNYSVIYRPYDRIKLINADKNKTVAAHFKEKFPSANIKTFIANYNGIPFYFEGDPQTAIKIESAGRINLGIADKSLVDILNVRIKVAGLDNIIQINKVYNIEIEALHDGGFILAYKDPFYNSAQYNLVQIFDILLRFEEDVVLMAESLKQSHQINYQFMTNMSENINLSELDNDNSGVITSNPVAPNAKPQGLVIKEIYNVDEDKIESTINAGEVENNAGAMTKHVLDLPTTSNQKMFKRKEREDGGIDQSAHKQSRIENHGPHN